MLAALVLGYLDLIPGVDWWVDSAGPAGQVVVVAVLTGALGAMLLCWFAAVWFAASTGRRCWRSSWLSPGSPAGSSSTSVTWRGGLAMVRPPHNER